MSTTNRRRNAKLKARVLLDLIKGSTALWEEDSNIPRGPRVYIALQRFMSEVFSYIKEEGLVKCFLPERSDCEKTSGNSKSLMKGTSKIRVLKIGSIWQRSRSKYATFKKERSVPFIRLSGLWLENCGFVIGNRIAVYQSKKQLILREIGDCIKYSNMGEGGSENG